VTPDTAKLILQARPLLPTPLPDAVRDEVLRQAPATAPYSDNPALNGAWKKGRDAAKDGKPITANPYTDHRTVSGRLTWARAFVRAWNDGWHSVSHQHQSADFSQIEHRAVTLTERQAKRMVKRVEQMVERQLPRKATT
jgi:hypothetical protein